MVERMTRLDDDTGSEERTDYVLAPPQWPRRSEMEDSLGRLVRAVAAAVVRHEAVCRSLCVARSREASRNRVARIEFGSAIYTECMSTCLQHQCIRYRYMIHLVIPPS